MKKSFWALGVMLGISALSFGQNPSISTSFNQSAIKQDTGRYELKLAVPVVDLPQNTKLPGKYPSMNQSFELANDFYELGFWGIDKATDVVIKIDRQSTSGRKITNFALKYALGLGFSRYGSELPIPLGVWAHEEFHRSVLGVNKVSSINGNWLLNGWDGTVYGVSDATLADLKQKHPNELLYSYVSGVQSEILFNQKISINDFYNARSIYKNAFLLYNAWYVYDYFNAATSPVSDRAKADAPTFESKEQLDRDFAGNDLTAWVYDMYKPDEPYTNRPALTGLNGVNRRVGYSDLSADAQKFLRQQKRLTLLNFINPAIFFVNRIHLNQNFSFNFFAQYAPTHFGNNIAIYAPLKIKGKKYLAGLHSYNNNTKTTWGADIGMYDYAPFSNKHINFDMLLHLWSQPESFYSNSTNTGGAIELKAKTMLNKNFSAFIAANAKTQGWLIGNPYLEQNLSGQLGVAYQLKSKGRASKY